MIIKQGQTIYYAGYDPCIDDAVLLPVFLHSQNEAIPEKHIKVDKFPVSYVRGMFKKYGSGSWYHSRRKALRKFKAVKMELAL